MNLPGFTCFYFICITSIYSQETSCRYADSTEIFGNSAYSACFGNTVDLKVNSETIQSPTFYWYDDPELTSLVFVGNIFEFQVTESKEFFVAVEGLGVCKSMPEGAKKISINKIDLPVSPTLPGSSSYFSAQGIGLDIQASLSTSQSPSDFDLVFLNSYDQEIHVGGRLKISSSLPRGTYYYSVLSKSKITGCSSEKINFSVYVDDPSLEIENCSSASASIIDTWRCPGCNVINQSLAVDSNIETFSQISTIKNSFNGYVGQNVIF